MDDVRYCFIVTDAQENILPYQVQAFRLTSGPGGGAILPPRICLILTQLDLTKNFLHEI